MIRIYLDTETSGLNPSRAHVIEVGAVVVDAGGREVATFQTLADPGEEAMRDADPNALGVNGLTHEVIHGAPAVGKAADGLAHFLADYGGAPVHSFNVSFDRGFLSRSPWLLTDGWDECVMLAAEKAMRAYKWPRLEEAAAFFKVPHAVTHRALGDARIAALIHRAILVRRGGGQASEP